MGKLISMALLVALMAPLAAEDFMPVLRFKQVDGKTIAHKADGTTKLAEWSDIEAHLEKYAKLSDQAEGWKGRDKDGICHNLLVVHADADTSADAVFEMLGDARKKLKFAKVAVAVTEHLKPRVTALPGEPKAPDAAKLGDAYLVADLYTKPTDDPPEIPKEMITLYAFGEPAAAGASFVVAIDVRGRVVVEDSFASCDAITLNRDDVPGARRQKEQLRKTIHDNIVKAVEDYIVRSGAKIEKARFFASLHTEWVFIELGWQALNKVNANRAAADKDALTLMLPFQFEVADPPPPEQPPERPVEFPRRGEPEAVDPTEDKRIVEDGKDEASNPPQRKAVGLGGGTGNGGRGGDSAFTHRRVAHAKSDRNDRITAALEWLKDHQSREGYWSATTFVADSTRKSAKATGNIEFADQVKTDTGWENTTDIGLTGLALLAFSGSGFDHKGGDFRNECRLAVLHLRRIQDNDGCFGLKEDNHFVYNHAIATLAMAEIYGLTGDAVIKPILEKAVEFILKAQNPGLGWRYGVRPGINDTSVTAWMVKALYAAKLAEIEVDYDKAFGDAAEWFKLVTVDVRGYPKVGYDSPGSNNARLRGAMDYDNNPSMDALYISCMLFMGKATAEDRTVKGLASSCIEAASLPKWEPGSRHSIDFYYWYAGSLAMHQMGGTHWATWEKACSRIMLDHQRGWHESDKKAELTSAAKLDEHGSWDPVGAWGTAGGRVYATAMGALILQTPQRYLRVSDK